MILSPSVPVDLTRIDYML